MLTARLRFEVDSVAADRRLSLVPRLAAVAIFGGTLGGNLGWSAAALWISAGLFIVAWGAVVWRDQPSPGNRTTILRLASILAESLLMTSMAVAYWQAGGEFFRLLSYATLAIFVLLSQSYFFKCRMMVLASGAVPTAALLLLPTVWGGFEGFQRFSFFICSVNAAVYLLLDARQNIGNARALRRAEAALLAQTEAALAASRAKSAFLAMMSHELRTPMNGVLGMAHALTLTKLSARQASHVKMLVRSGQDLMAILNDILDISKIESGKLELEETSFDLQQVAGRVVEVWGETARAKAIDLILEIAEETPAWVRGDPTRLRQILMNLVSNALKFTTVGEVRLSIVAPSEGVCEFHVSDTGPGIPQDQQARLFQSFTQADASVTRRFGGTGLGLAICKQLATLMGGEIGLQSQEGEGSTFTVRLPLATTAPETPADEQDGDVDLSALSVLVADDNRVNQTVARAILEAYGATVAVAGDGAEALDQLAAGRFDVVLMDIHMPGMDGVEALTRIRRGIGGRSDQPVIALTADAMPGVDAGLLARGFNAVVAKPVNPTALVEAIGRVTEARPASTSRQVTSVA